MSVWADHGAPKLDRAREHIHALSAVRSEFLGSGSIERVTTPEGRPAVRVVSEPPLRIGAIAGDAIHNLRASLDVLWNVAMTRAGIAPKRRDQFPILDGATAYKQLRSNEKRTPLKALYDALDIVRPYKGANDALWQLHRLDIRDKHYVMVPVAVALIQEAVSDTRQARATVVIPRGFRHAVTLNIPGFETVTAPCDGIDIALNEPTIALGEPVMPLLAKLTNAVESAVDEFIEARLIA